MLKKLDYSFSISLPEIIEDANELLKEMDVEKEIEKYSSLIKGYLNDDKLYNDWLKHIDKQIHLSIPADEKNNCIVCNGGSQLEKDKACKTYYLKAEEELFLNIIFYVVFIENNKHLFNSKDLRSSLTNTFFKHFKFKDGKLSFDAKAFDNILMTQVLLILRELYANMETKEAIRELIDCIDELETHKVIAKSTDRILSDLVNPQIKFLKKQLKYYEKKLIIESTSSKKTTNKESVNYNKYTNVFQKSMPIQLAADHFKIFTSKNSNNGKPFLTEEQFDVFIKKAFCGVPNLPKQTFNQKPKGEKLLIQYKFREFYDKYWDYFGTSQVTEEFIKLLTDNFTGWNFNNVKNNFSIKPKSTIENQ